MDRCAAYRCAARISHRPDDLPSGRVLRTQGQRTPRQQRAKEHQLPARTYPTLEKFQVSPLLVCFQAEMYGGNRPGPHQQGKPTVSLGLQSFFQMSRFGELLHFQRARKWCNTFST